MHGSGVHIGGIPLIENAPVSEGFARNVWNPGVIAKFDERRPCSRACEGLRDGPVELMGGLQRLASPRIPDAFEHLAKALERRVHIRLIKGPGSLAGAVV